MIDWRELLLGPLAALLLLAFALVAALGALIALPFLASIAVIENLSLGLHPLYGLVRGRWTRGGWRPCKADTP